MPTQLAFALLALLCNSLTCQAAITAADAGVTESVKPLLASSTVSSLLQALRSSTFTCHQLIATQIWRGEQLNSQLNAVIRFRKTEALAEATAKDTAGATSDRLHCIPVIVKDNVDVMGVATTNGAPAFANMIAPADATIVTALKAAGAIIIGKANMAEMSDSGIDSNSTVGGLCKNPWNQAHSCLGSSGGSAAAVAAGLAVIGVGTDTEGSVIGPCVANGLVCIRPSDSTNYQDMLTGVYPAFSRQDSTGLMARNSADFIAAFDAVYNTSLSTDLGSSQNLSGLSVQVLSNMLDSFEIPGVISYACDAAVSSEIYKAAGLFGQLGAEVSNLSIPIAELGAQLGQILTATSAKPNCSRSCMVQDVDEYLTRYASTGPFRTTKDLVSVQSQLPSLYQSKLTATLQQNSSDICSDELDNSCKKYVEGRAALLAVLDTMIGNATILLIPFTAKLPQINGVTPPLQDQISAALNPYTGWPSITFPVGFAANKLPIGVVAIARAEQEASLIRLAHAYQLRSPQTQLPELVIGSAGRTGGAAAFGLVAAAISVLFMAKSGAVL